MTTGTALYFDGSSSARHNVTLEAMPEGLRILGANGVSIGQWPYGELRAQSAPDDVMRLRRAGGPELARLEIRDPALIAKIDDYADSLDRTGTIERRLRKKVIGWTFAAAVSLVLVGVFGLPALSDRIAPLIPLSAEQRLGAAMDQQVRAMLDAGRSDQPFECGAADAEKPGRAALDRLIGKLEAAAGQLFEMGRIEYDPDDEFSTKQLREMKDLVYRGPTESKDKDRIGDLADGFRTKIEAICRPVVDHQYGQYGKPKSPG